MASIRPADFVIVLLVAFAATTLVVAECSRGDSARIVALKDSIADYNRQFDIIMQQDSARADSVATLTTQVARLRGRAANLDTSFVYAVDTLRIALPDTLEPILDRIAALHTQEVASLQGALDSAQRVIGILTSRIAVQDTALRRANALLASAVAALPSGQPNRLRDAALLLGGVLLGKAL